MQFPAALQRLLDALRCLPGVGPKSAQRMALHLLERDRDGAAALAGALGHALDVIGHCGRCRMFAEQELCEICADTRRDESLLCVVESPADVIAVEESASYRGAYFVLMGRLSPLDGIGPEELGGAALEARLEGARELVIATSATVEGEATATWLATLARRHGVAASRIAHGVPVGGELEYVDSGTLSRAIRARTAVAGDQADD